MDKPETIARKCKDYVLNRINVQYMLQVYANVRKELGLHNDLSSFDIKTYLRNTSLNFDRCDVLTSVFHRHFHVTCILYDSEIRKMSRFSFPGGF